MMTIPGVWILTGLVLSVWTLSGWFFLGLVFSVVMTVASARADYRRGVLLYVLLGVFLVLEWLAHLPPLRPHAPVLGRASLIVGFLWLFPCAAEMWAGNRRLAARRRQRSAGRGGGRKRLK